MTSQQVATALAAALAEQPWYRRYAGTVTACLSGGVMLAALIPTIWADAPPWMLTALAVLAALGGAVGQRLTRNGFTPRGNVDMQEAIAASGSYAGVAVAAGETASSAWAAISSTARHRREVDAE